ncbi:cytochrome c biogenesis protein ResB [Sulfurirhabdus autotrophica]|uniref:Cytochrome c biogenesis protein n=1 Tax=Sulfurirhabdus autotrophica TaxID=1706046 RepID=A0A4V6P3S7_9PROT|nr:cytochrome c biogenesis protein ResB [Sulfurirhabdus autotrophica]TCV82379.1 cytochrome c biogenesis protein [Sulfurirhabdus autotrophica]
MRFAISLLTVLAIASIIGTVLKQNEPYPNYVIEFGQFWFPLFKTMGLYDVYHTSWFLAILVFLVISTSLCIYRNTPLMLREMRSFREHAQENSLRHFSHQAEYEATISQEKLLPRLTDYLTKRGYRLKVNDTESGVMVAAKAGSYHRVGYILTHSAIVIICIGGLLDGNVPLKLQEALGFKKIETRDIPESQVSTESRLSPSNLSFRGNVTIPEGMSADVVFLNVGEGYLVQDLPFNVALKKFHIEHYTTGQPKSFASDLVVTDKETGESIQHTITVNHPLIYKGVAIYQASFGDGGTHFTLNGWNLLSPLDKSFPVDGKVNGSTKLTSGQNQYTIEFTEFRPFNIENTGAGVVEEVKKSETLAQSAMSVFGTNAAGKQDKGLHNVGPSFQYKVRDAQGQATEYSNYMLPILLENRWYLLSGIRSNPGEPLRYVRFPMDDGGSIEGFMRLRAALFDKAMYPEIAKRFAKDALQGEAVSETLRSKLIESTERVLEMFGTHGYDALAKFIQQAVPKAEQEKAAQTYLKILEGAVFDAYQLTRERAGQSPAKMDANSLQFVRDSLNTISDLFFYGAPVYLQLVQYDEVKATGLQLTRSPGKNIVYGGSALLILGVFAMFYIRERRIWLLLKPQDGKLLFAMSGNRKTLDFEKEFNLHKQDVAALLKE